MANVLVIDDDPQFTDIIQFQIREFGHEVDIAHTKPQAESYIQAKTYNLILLDVFFPNKDDGLNLLLEIKKTPTIQDTPVILATSLPSELFMQEPNFDDYLEQAKEFISKTDNTKKIAERINEIVTSK